jgi:hypothetical protein
MSPMLAENSFLETLPSASMNARARLRGLGATDKVAHMASQGLMLIKVPHLVATARIRIVSSLLKARVIFTPYSEQY